MTHAPVQQQPAPIYVKAPSNGLATAAMVLGIIGAALAFIPLLGAFGAFLGGVGIALAIAGLVVASKRKVGKGKAIAGLILGIASIIIFFAVTAATVAAVDEAVTEIDKEIQAQADTSEATDLSNSDEIGDAKLGKIKTGMFGLTVKVTLTNTSDNVSDYSSTVVFESSDGKTQYGTGFLFTENLSPGQTKVEEVMMMEELPKNANDVVARLTDFDRMQSF